MTTGSMKKDLMQWVKQRLAILKQMAPQVSPMRNLRDSDATHNAAKIHLPRAFFFLFFFWSELVARRLASVRALTSKRRHRRWLMTVVGSFGARLERGGAFAHVLDRCTSRGMMPAYHGPPISEPCAGGQTRQRLLRDLF